MGTSRPGASGGSGGWWQGRGVVAALVVVPGPNGTVTFVRQERGPDARWWLLPGGKVEFGEPVAAAARREAMEESGCDVGELVLTGAYEIVGPGHHFVMWAYHSQRMGLVPARFSGHHVGAVRQERWDRLEPHPTDMPILNDAGAANYHGGTDRGPAGWGADRHVQPADRGNLRTLNRG